MLVSAVHVPGGTFIHSAVGLAPHAFVLALEGIAIAVGWVAARRSSWNAASATRFFTVAAIGFAWSSPLGARSSPRPRGRPAATTSGSWIAASPTPARLPPTA